jgi:aspartate kinase
MNIIIKKFGGTSLANLERIVRAMSYIKKTKKLGFNVVVVVSAMGKETDRLLNLTSNLHDYKLTDDISSLLSSGEQISSSYFLLF